MRTHAAVVVTANIAIEAKNAEGFWKPIASKPAKEHDASGHFFAVLRSIIIRVIDGQKFWLALAAARALMSIVVKNNFFPLVVVALPDLPTVLASASIFFSMVCRQLLCVSFLVSFLILSPGGRPTLRAVRPIVAFAALHLPIHGKRLGLVALVAISDHLFP